MVIVPPRIYAHPEVPISQSLPYWEGSQRPSAVNSTANAEGLFSVSVSSGSWVLARTRERSGRVWLEPRAGEASPLVRGLVLDEPVPGGALLLHIRDAEGRPLESPFSSSNLEVRVEGREIRKQETLSFSLQRDDDSIELWDIPAGEVLISVRDPSGHDAPTKVKALVREGKISEVEVRLAPTPTGSVAGVVLDPAGQAVTRGRISLRREGEQRSNGVDLAPGGKFRFDAVDLSPGGEFRIEVPGSLSVRRWLDQVGTGPLSLQLPNGPLAHLRVVDERKRPLSLVDVQVSMHGSSVRVQTDAEGQVRLRLPRAGQVDVALSSKGYLRSSSQHVVRADDRLDLVLYAEADRSRVGARIRGRMLDRAGQPLEGLPVEAGGRQAKTDAQGRFELEGVPPGLVTLRGGKGSFLPLQRRLELRAGQVLEGVELLAVCRAKVRGRVEGPLPPYCDLVVVGPQGEAFSQHLDGRERSFGNVVFPSGTWTLEVRDPAGRVLLRQSLTLVDEEERYDLRLTVGRRQPRPGRH